MMRIDTIIKPSVYTLFIGFLFGLFLFILPSLEVNAVDPSPVPVLTITTPINNSYHKNQMVEFTGSVFDDVTANAELSLKAIIDPDSIIGAIPVPITVNDDGSWIFSNEFAEGTHQITFELKDSDDNFEEQTLTIYIDSTRPLIKSIKIAQPGITDENLFWPAEDMTQVPLESKIIVTVKDESSIDYVNFLSVFLADGAPNEGPLGLIVKPPFRNINGDWEITFTPESLLAYNKTYFVYINPFINDSAGNFLFPKFFKFSSMSDKDPEDAHGNHMANTQSCANCHSTHTATGEGLQGGKYGNVSASNYCMACHDGTGGAPVIKYFQSHKHQLLVGKKTDTCTSCHNPHSAWSKENPNRLKDHFVFDHQGSTMDPPRLIDSDVELCESCHEQNAAIVKNQNHYRLLTYKKSMTATGNSDDFSLCFKCHDGSKASNIMQYYSNPTLISASGHNIIASDGSPLNGQMPCSDCHVTHGSANIKGLKTKLGHVKREDLFSTTSTDWTAFDERQFCLKCHAKIPISDTEVEMYGGKATLSATDSSGNDIPEHNPASETACSYCHGGDGSDFLEQSRNAAHAPLKQPTNSP
jgi:hypothetical protein